MTTGAGLGERLRERMERAGFPACAPVAMAEEVAVDAYRAGATADEAFEAGWSFLSSWTRHPSNIFVDSLPSTGSGVSPTPA